jgi:DNA-binding transcriptional LysR family regulator
MLLSQLEAFVEAARRGNVSRAAEALYLTQPALTARLKGLEAELGVDLLVRTTRGVRLSDAGKEFLPYAQRALEAVSDGKHFLAELARGGAGRLAIGVAPAVSTSVLPSMLSRFRAEHPNVQVVVRTGHSEEIRDMVLREQVEFGLVRELRHPEIVGTPLYEDELILVVEPSHPFAGKPRLRVADFASEHLILFDHTSTYHELTSSLFREAGVVPRGVMELDTIDAAKKMVEKAWELRSFPIPQSQASSRRAAWLRRSSRTRRLFGGGSSRFGGVTSARRRRSRLRSLRSQWSRSWQAANRARLTQRSRRRRRRPERRADRRRSARCARRRVLPAGPCRRGRPQLRASSPA